MELYYDGNSYTCYTNERFHAPEGVLRFVMETGEEPIKINGVLDEFSDVWSYGNDDEIILKGKGLGLKGLYTFEIAIEKVLWTDESLDDVEIFRTDVSVVEDITHVQHDSNGSSVKFETRSYFDIVTDFEYDYNEKRVYFQIPFDWDDKAISHIPVVHIEVRFPNNFTEFYSVGYTGTANGIDSLPDPRMILSYHRSVIIQPSKIKAYILHNFPRPQQYLMFRIFSDLTVL